MVIKVRGWGYVTIQETGATNPNRLNKAIGVAVVYHSDQLSAGLTPCLDSVYQTIQMLDNWQWRQKLIFFFIYLDYIDYKTGKKRSTDPLITKTAISSGPNLKKNTVVRLYLGTDTGLTCRVVLVFINGCPLCKSQSLSSLSVSQTGRCLTRWAPDLCGCCSSLCHWLISDLLGWRSLLGHTEG